MSPRRRRARAVSFAAVTLAAAAIVLSGVRISPDVSALLPNEADGGALATYVRAFGGSDPALVLIQGDAPADVELAAHEVAGLLRDKPSLAAIASEASFASKGPPALDPTLAFRLADAGAMERLRRALTPEGMRARLAETRALLLAPGAAGLEEFLRRDPLRLSQIPFESGGELFAGGRVRSDGELATEDGTARLVVLWPKQSALTGASARATASDVEGALASVRARYPSLRFGFTGGHAIAAATEAMLRADLVRSGALSLVLSGLAFALTFARTRALLALLPPLLVGTLWTAALGIFVPGGLAGIAVAFTAVVVGVGVDTGVHVYAALLRARRDGQAPEQAARSARAGAARPVLLAAVAAGSAFASLGLSQVSAIRQLGLLCAAGEVLTAIAILVLLPELGALLERKEPPPHRAPAWIALVARATNGKGRAAAALALAGVPLALGVVFHAQLGGAVFAVRPAGLAPLQVQSEVYRLFGGRQGQWVLLLEDVDRERALWRADTIVEALARAPSLVDGFDSMTRFFPSQEAQRRRLALRDALDLPARAADLESALQAEGFAVDAFSPAIEALRHPSHQLQPAPALASAAAESELTQPLIRRHLAESDGKSLVALYVRPAAAAEDELERVVRAADPGVAITGYAKLEASLRAALLRDLPRVALVSAVLVVVSLLVSLRRKRDVILAVLALAVEIGAVSALARLFSIPLHLYDALVLPALFGITVDEAIFLLERAREEGIEQALRTEGPAVAATALTTSAGFAALLVCEFAPLRHLGALGALGSLVGLVSALVVVPAGLRLAENRR